MQLSSCFEYWMQETAMRCHEFKIQRLIQFIRKFQYILLYERLFGILSKVYDLFINLIKPKLKFKIYKSETK